jgi:hypothetical protein
MATMNDIVTAALGRLRIIAAGETPASADATDGLTALNTMMHGWRADGVDTLHTTLLGTDDFPLDDSFIRGVTALLTVYIADTYGRSPVQGVMTDASRGWDALCAQYSPANLLTLDTGLTRMPSQLNRVWVTNNGG